MIELILELCNKKIVKEQLNLTSDSHKNIPLEFNAPQKSPILRIWFNTLLEFKDGQVQIIKSYSCPARESDVQKWQKPKEPKKPVPKPSVAVKIDAKEEY